MLRELGYTNLRHYVGGMEDWLERRGSIEQDAAAPARAAPAPIAPSRRTRSPRRGLTTRLLIDMVARRSIGALLRLWTGMVLGFGFLYWLAALLFHDGLRQNGVPVPGSFNGLLSSIYFSFVTALSIGYGDVTPTGALRALAIAEGAGGLLLFGVVISRLVGHHQEQIVEETHRIAFEDRLGRVRTNLHLVLSDLQAIAGMCANPETRPERLNPRLESAAAVFEGELRAIHDLLYRPQQDPDEAAMEAILAMLAANMEALGDLLACTPPSGPATSMALRSSLHHICELSNEICGECVPRAYAPHLRAWMDRIQEEGRRIAGTLEPLASGSPPAP